MAPRPKSSCGSYPYGYGSSSYGFPMVVLWFSDGLPMISMASLPKSSFGFCSYAYGSY